jgi:transposase
MRRVSEPTMRRWLARYRQQGLTGLQRRLRSDRGKRRSVSLELVAPLARQRQDIGGDTS